MDYTAVLSKYDEIDCYEFPSKFDYKAFSSKVETLWKELRIKFNRDFFLEGMSYCQDASFGSAIILAQVEDKVKKVIHLSVIRFSNFGDLVTITDPSMIENDMLQVIISLLESNGYKYIPPNELDKEYDGVMRNKHNFKTWWFRYFDWL